MVQWLGLLGTFTTRTRVQSRIRELRSLQAKNKQKKRHVTRKKWGNNMKKKISEEIQRLNKQVLFYWLHLSFPTHVAGSESRVLITGMPRNSLKLFFNLKKNFVLYRTTVALQCCVSSKTHFLERVNFYCIKMKQGITN